MPSMTAAAQCPGCTSFGALRPSGSQLWHFTSHCAICSSGSPSTDVLQHKQSMTKITVKKDANDLSSKGVLEKIRQRQTEGERGSDPCSLGLNSHSNASSMYPSLPITEWGQDSFNSSFPRWSPAVATCCCLSACVVFYAPPSWTCCAPA